MKNAHILTTKGNKMISKINFNGLHGLNTSTNRKNLNSLLDNSRYFMDKKVAINAIRDTLDYINFESRGMDVFIKTTKAKSTDENYSEDIQDIKITITDKNDNTIAQAMINNPKLNSNTSYKGTHMIEDLIGLKNEFHYKTTGEDLSQLPLGCALEDLYNKYA